MRTIDITIATAPSGSADPLAADNEIRLTKAALLYADKVTLVSPLLTLLLSVRALGQVQRADRIQFIRAVAPAVGMAIDDEVLSQLEQLLRLNRQARRKMPGLSQTLKGLDRRLAEMWNPLEAKTEEIWAASGGEELAVAIESGLLTVDAFAAGTGDTDQMVNEFSDRLQQLLASDTSYPMFDDAVANLVSAGVREGMFTPSSQNIRHGQHAGIAASFMSEMPAFPKATVNEILDIRDELKAPLIRFRSGVAEMSRHLSSAAFDEPFPAELSDLYVEHVQPALLEIREAVSSNRYLRQLMNEVVSAPGLGATGVAGVLTFGSVTFGELVGLFAAGAVAVTPALRAKWQQHLSAKEVSRQKLYLLYRANELLQ